ncbi:MAG: T9SS type A sorting domain-containing protein [candidate division Zixibacteria bacterium]|nr:T9SS type A sorting domain-containing protein [candidate division Zixibacteria bacterium]
MKKLSIIWLGVIIFLSFQFLSTYSSEIKPSVKAVNEETDGCNCRGDLDRNGVINPADLEYMAKVIRHEISPDPSLAECADLNYNGLSYEMGDYTILQSWMSAYHVILCGKEKLTLASLKISKVKAKPGETFTLPVLIKNYITVGGFDLQIGFDPTLLYFKGVQRGEALAVIDSTGSYQWEYFTYRQIPNPGSFIYKLEILGIYEIRNLHKGVPLQPVSDFVELAVIKFQVAFDNSLRGTKVPVNFYWDSNTCTENSLCDQTGNILHVSNDTLQFNFIDCDTSNIYGNRVVTSLHFEDGEVNIPEAPVAQVGDINLNGIPYEVADAVLFLSYFMEGTAVFTIDSAQQVANSDIDGNGKVLTLSDFVLMTRIMLHGATPGDTTGYSDKIAYFTTSLRDSIFLFSFNSEAPIGAALFTFDCSDIQALPYLYSTNMDLIYKINNNELRVLVFSLGGANIPSGPVDLLAIPLENACTLTILEVVDDKGRVMKAIYGTTGISDQPAHDVPKTFALLPNYPNPFNPETFIEYTLPADCQVTLAVYNILGQKVRTLINEYQLAGLKSVRWDGKDDSGNQVSAGVYFYSIKADNFTQTKKMILLK